jgi:DNA ligase-1
MSIKIIITKNKLGNDNTTTIKLVKSTPKLNKPKVLSKSLKISEHNHNHSFHTYSKIRPNLSNPISPMLGDFYYSLNKKSYAIDDPTGYWMSEKLDGVRAIWQFPYLKTRNGHLIKPPAKFLEDFPTNITLDGELYVGRKKFGEALSIVRNGQTADRTWLTQIKYYVFDIPDSTPLIFEQVKEILQTCLANSSYIIPIKQTKCQSRTHLQTFHQALIRQGAEGTMLRKPRTSYSPGRTQNILKYKSQWDSSTKTIKDVLDENVKVVGYKYDPTRDNRIKSVMVKWCDTEKYPYDPEFSVYHNLTRLELDQAKTLFPLMTIIKINFNEIFPSSQKPRFPRYAGKLDSK